MSSKKFRKPPELASGRTSYRRPNAEQFCSHVLEAHVVYDLKASGYRAQLRCRCTKVKVDGPKVRSDCKKAEADSRIMMQAATKIELLSASYRKDAVR